MLTITPYVLYLQLLTIDAQLQYLLSVRLILYVLQAWQRAEPHRAGPQLGLARESPHRAGDPLGEGKLGLAWLGKLGPN